VSASRSPSLGGNVVDSFNDASLECHADDLANGKKAVDHPDSESGSHASRHRKNSY
jgi:hypothetical protein